ncbi:MAG: hypothetical protein GIKADHBN_01360 [Phycisphaerales bacterium]|nr:hypothetical protein [Phycisphaerales bacterium]MCK6476134.1 hypothetical protein [Phycisphaerales bacterium]
MNPTSIAILLVAGPPRLVMEPDAQASQAWTIAAALLGAAAVFVLLMAAAFAWVWSIDRRRSTDPTERGFIALSRAAGLSASQRSLVRRLAANLGPHAAPAGLLLSKAALRRAVAAELERKPEPASVRQLQKLVEALVGDIASPPQADREPKPPPAARVDPRNGGRSASGG